MLILFIRGGSKWNNNTPSSTSTVSTNATNKQSTEKESEPQATPITFKQVVNDYNSNGVVADNKYKGKTPAFTGKVSKITKGTYGGSDVTIDAGNFTTNQFMDTSATINFKNIEDVKTLVTGQEYHFIAKGNGATVMKDNWVSSLNFKNGKISQ